MMRPRVLLALPLLLAVACDQPSKEELDTMIQDGARQQVEQLEAKLAKAAEENQEDPEQALAKRVETLEVQLADVSSQLVGLQAGNSELRTQIEALKKGPDKPVPEVRPGRPDPAQYYKVEVGDAQKKGSDSALVTIVTWSDFQCPYCQRVTSTIEGLRKDYGKDLRYVFKHNPLAFHKDARPAAIAAEAAGEQGKFWEMHDKLFENSRDLTEKNFISWARELGLNVKQFKRDLDSSAIADRVDQQQRDGNALGAKGTPAFFVNGRFLSGAQPAANFKKLIDEEMKKAQAKVAAGTSPTRVYAETVATGRTAP
ncbi:MAG: thioredoxin domain-containing protein [Deltaproteobacteria bacterium]|nr:thioredoxin domain-containing protein [Deltaproteobacteria bacterium]